MVAENTLLIITSKWSHKKFNLNNNPKNPEFFSGFLFIKTIVNSWF
jgi:hypothetical protein